MPHPPVLRALEETKAALEKAGHEGKFLMVGESLADNILRLVIEYSLEGFERTTYLMWNILSADGAEDVKTILGAVGEVSFIRCEAFNDLKFQVNQTFIDEMKSMADAEELSVFELYQLCREKELLQNKFLRKWLATGEQTSTKRPIDGLIMPVAPWTAPPFLKNDNVEYTGTPLH